MESLPEKINYGELKLTEIVTLLASCSNEVSERCLLNAFFNKVNEKFYDRCAKCAGRLYKGAPDIKAITDDIFQDSRLIILEKIKGFKINPQWDENECEKVLLFWMAEFPNNLLLKKQKDDKIEKQKFEKYIHHHISESRLGSIGKHTYSQTYDRVKFDKLWGNFNPMTREIIMFCVGNDMFESDGPKHIPSEFRQYLCKKFNVEEDAIRQAKRRALLGLDSCKI